MNILNHCDMFVGGSEADYKLIANISGVDVKFFSEVSIIRGGCFWSDRCKMPIPGVLKSGAKLPLNEFISRLENTEK